MRLSLKKTTGTRRCISKTVTDALAGALQGSFVAVELEQFDTLSNKMIRDVESMDQVEGSDCHAGV